MYLARLSAGEVQLVLGGVRLTYPAPGGGSASGYSATDYWADSLRALARSALAATPLSLSIRVTLDASGSLSAAIGALTEGGNEEALRRWLAGYTRLERAVPETVALPVVREEYDALFRAPNSDAAPWQFARTSAPDYRHDDQWIACDFHLAPHLGDLLLEAKQLGHPLVAQLNLTSFAPSETQVREARRHVVRLRDAGRAPGALLQLQQRLAERLSAAAYLVEEYVGSTPAVAHEWLAAALESRFRRQFAGLPFADARPAFAPADLQQGLDPPLHSSLLDPEAVGVAELCASAEDDGALERTLGWMPPNALRFVPPADAPDEPPLAPNVLPPALPPVHGGDGYIFISYSHSDAPRIASHLAALRDASVPFWYDAGIPSGSEWDSVIESRIERCQALVVFLSPRAVASKYVRREVKFADALDKPVVAVVLEPAHLREGLRMLLTQYQMVDASVADIPNAVRQAIARRVA